jgi:hypothetical protein
MLKDIAWAFIFPEEYIEYRLKASKRNVAKMKVVSCDGNSNYTVEMMEIAPEHGRILIPTGMQAETTLHDIHLAIVTTAMNE